MQLSIGIFFDGTANNAANVKSGLGDVLSPSIFHPRENSADLARQIKNKTGFSGVQATSYLASYTNIYLMSLLYSSGEAPENNFQQAIYIEGCGTQNGQPDNYAGLAFGAGATGVTAKAESALMQVKAHILAAVDRVKPIPVLDRITFDVFGFSRGATTARYFCNYINAPGNDFISDLGASLTSRGYTTIPPVTCRFLGLLDSVSALPDALTRKIHRVLHPGVAQQVFHIIADHECRAHFSLDSAGATWPELRLPGTHSDIGGGYLPIVHEQLCLSRIITDTVQLDTDCAQTAGFSRTQKTLAEMQQYSAIAPLLRHNEIELKTWCDERYPQDRYGNFMKRCASVLMLKNRTVYNGWSYVALRVMLDAASDAGITFAPVTTLDISLPAELEPLLETAIVMGRAVREKRASSTNFSAQDMALLMKSYIHCSAHWNEDTVLSDADKLPFSATLVSLNRPAPRWCRQINMLT